MYKGFGGCYYTKFIHIALSAMYCKLSAVQDDSRFLYQCMVDKCSNNVSSL